MSSSFTSDHAKSHQTHNSAPSAGAATAGSSINSSSAQQQQQLQQPWASAAAAQRPRRGLAPISTSTSTNASSSSAAGIVPAANRPPSSSASSRNPWSPSNTNFISAANRQTTRSPSVSSNNGHFSPPPLLPGSSAAQNRSRTLTSSTNSQFASAPPSSQGVASSGAASARLSRASPSVSTSSFPSPGAASGSAQAGQLSKIVIAQLFLLLSTLKEDGDKAKWESQVEQIRKLVDSNGMEVFTKYFRRLLSSNAGQIFGTSRSADSSGSYHILVQEIQKITKDPAQASKIAESIDQQGDENVFKDFDLSSFMEHFKMNATAKVTLASAFRKASRPDLRTKADAIITSNLNAFVSNLAKTTPLSDREDDFPPDVLATVVDRLAQFPPRNWNADMLGHLQMALQQHFHNAGMLVPMEIGSAMNMFDLLAQHNPLVRLIQRNGPKATESVDSCKAVLETAELQDISYQQVANALLFMVIASDDPSYDPKVFISALREHRGGQRLDWQDVVHAFDREGVKVTKAQLKGLFDALMILAREYENFDIQLLWGGDWHYAETQMSFASAFLSFSQDELDASQIPRLRAAYTKEDFEDAAESPEKIQEFTDRALRHPMVSLEASRALFNMVFRSSETYAHAQSLGVIENVINPKMDLFVCSVCAVSKPWGALQDQAMKQLIAPMFMKNFESYGLVLHLLWKRDRMWMLTRLNQFYQQNPLNLLLIHEHARERGWLDEIIAQNNELSLDLAALAHGRGQYDLDEWLEQLARAMPGLRLLNALSSFLKTRAEDDIAVHREGTNPTAVPLTVRTVHALLNFLGNSGLSEDDQVALQRTAIQAYPRLINYGEGFDELIDENGKNGNALPSEADAKMQDYYKQMYSGEKQVRDIVEVMQRLKTSEDSSEQDLFACMIYGLFDEFTCFSEYPLDALATTAVLFGSIINFHLLSRVALKTALAMVLEAVRDYEPNDAMYKFGLQALLHFKDRLEEWKMFSERLLHVQCLRGTQIFSIVERVVREQRDETSGNVTAQDPGESRNVDDFLAPEVPDFSCLAVDPPTRDIYEDPSDQVQESVLFILNNISERNFGGKLDELRLKLREEYFQWFANYLVEQRIKSQPNFHQLYMEMLEKLNEGVLWTEVLRETYISCFRMLNSEATMNSSTERAHLKHLGSWLGSITLARSRPIKHRNISFKDLLVEAHATQRLIVAIPFTCTVLSMAAKSAVFKLPNAWTEELVAILLELYDEGDLRLPLKFEIEILTKALEVDIRTAERSTVIQDMRNNPPSEDEMLAMAGEGSEGLNELPVANFGRRGLMDRLTAATAIPGLDDLASILKHNYPLPHQNVVYQASIRNILNQATERALHEIISPVVDRSVTIAAISTSQLVAKDFAAESDDTKYQEAAHTSVRALAGSLALVTCKDPLKSSIQTHVRLLSQQMPNHLADGTVVMFINDNLDAVCSIIEKAAEAAAIPEIDAQIEEALQARRDGTFVPGELPRWNNLIPEPYRQTLDGLNSHQLAIYTEFGRSGRGGIAHASSLSQDNVRQLPDILQDQFTGMGSMVTPGETSTLPRQLAQYQQLSQTPNPPHAVNGYQENKSTSDLLLEIQQAATEAVDANPSRDLLSIDVIRSDFRQVINPVPGMGSHQETLLLQAEREILQMLKTEQLLPRVQALFAHLLQLLCQKSELVKQDFYRYFQSDADQAFNSDVVFAFVKENLLDLRLVDSYCASALTSNRGSVALHFLDRLVDHLLPEAGSGFLRADLVHSMSQLPRFTEGRPESEVARNLLKKLTESPNLDESPPADSATVAKTQFDYIFDEWVRLLSNAPEFETIASFARQIHKKNILASPELTSTFLRICLDSCVERFENVDLKPTATVNALFSRTDALAKLIVNLAINHTSNGPDSVADKVRFLESQLVQLVLMASHSYQFRRDGFNTRVYHRLFSSILCEIWGMADPASGLLPELISTVAKYLKYLEPSVFPGFAFAYLSLISHRLLLPVMCSPQNQQNWSIYRSLLCIALAYVGDVVKPLDVPIYAKELFRGLQAILLVLHHDFPEFLVENHFELLNAIPVHITQMRSLITSAATVSFGELPNAFTEGLQDELEEMRRQPRICGDVEGPMRNVGILHATQSFLRDQDEDLLQAIAEGLSVVHGTETTVDFAPLNVNAAAISAVVIFAVQYAEFNSSDGQLNWSPDSSSTKLVEGLLERLSAEGRFFLINAIVDQLRYPNSHTNYFIRLLFHLWKPGQSDKLSLDIQQQITRVLLGRVIVHRPHPWGLIVTLQELLTKHVFDFWNLPCVKGNSDIEQMFSQLAAQMGQNH